MGWAPTPGVATGQLPAACLPYAPTVAQYWHSLPASALMDPTETPETVIDTALAAASEIEDGDQADAKKQERAAVMKWLDEISQAREFDKEYYRQIAYNRAVASGVSAHEVSVNIIGSNIDTLKSVLYAKNPDITVRPAPQTSLPTMERPLAPVPPQNPLPTLQGMLTQGGAALPGGTGQLVQDPAVAQRVLEMKQQYEMRLSAYEKEKQLYDMEMQAFLAEMRQRKAAREERKRFSETLEILISKSWQLADLKTQMRYGVGATLTTSLGWLKATWQEDAGLDPVVENELQSLQANLRAIEVQRAALAAGIETPNLDALQQDLAEKQAALESAKEAVIARGWVVDTVAGEDMTIPIGVTRAATATASSPWLAQRIFMERGKAYAMFPDVSKECWRKATYYSQRRPKMSVRRVDIDDAPSHMDLTIKGDPSQFTTGAEGKTAEMVESGTGEFVCIHEIWDKADGIIRTVAEGVPVYLRPPHAPEIAVTRFYPFYCMAFVETDGSRYPDALTARSGQLQDERNARLSAAKKIRARSKQGILGDATALDKDEAGKFVISTEGELTLIRTTGEKPIQNIFMEKPVVRMDPALYATDDIDRNMERIWGVQEARAGAINTEKTATEADIQESGFNARVSFMREPEEAVLNEMAVATAETLLQRLTLEDAQAYCGPGAVWPEAAKVSDLASLVTVSIKAGSTGKPNTAAERAAWNAAAPTVLQTIQQIGTLRGASPQEMADKMEGVLGITLRLLGSPVSVEEIVPQESMPIQQPAAADGMAPPADAAPTGPMPPVPAPAGPPVLDAQEGM